MTQALATVLQNRTQLADMRRAWSEIDFESVRNQSALVCNCRHEDLIQLLEVDFLSLLDGLQATSEPVRDVMLWADDCCERLMGSNRGEDRSTLSSRSVLIRWGYVTSQIMRDLVCSCPCRFFSRANLPRPSAVIPPLVHSRFSSCSLSEYLIQLVDCKQS